MKTLPLVTAALALLLARDRAGNIACYPLVQNVHRDGILRLTFAPAPRLSVGLQECAERWARALLEALRGQADRTGVVVARNRPEFVIRVVPGEPPPK